MSTAPQTSFSSYASRFLSSGIAAAPSSSRLFQQQPSASTSLRPFSTPDDEADDLYGQGYDEDIDGDDDAKGLNRRDGRRAGGPGRQSQGRHAVPHLTGASRKAIQAGRGRQGEAIYDEREEEEENDDDDEDNEYADSLRDNRRLVGLGVAPGHLEGSGTDSLLGASEQTPSASLVKGTRAYPDIEDPFIRHEDLVVSSSDSPEASRTSPTLLASRRTKSTEKPKGKERATPPQKTMARSKGWLAHAADSISSLSSASNGYGRNDRRVQDSLYSDEEYEDDEENGDSEVEARRGGNTRARSASRGRRDAYSLYDDDDDDDQDDDDDESRSSRSEDSRDLSRKQRRTQSMREPLMSSSTSSERTPRPPGAFTGTTSRMIAADIYNYPHPPARSGWTPFAPGNSVHWREYKDKAALGLWLSFVLATLVLAGWVALGAKSITVAPSDPSVRPSPYYTLTRSVPILFLLTLLSVGAAASNLFFLRNFSRFGGAHVLRYGLLGVPVVLAFGWMWAFAGSFIYDDEKWTGGSWSTTGLRILSLIPLIAAALFARAVWKRRAALARSLAVLELSATIVAEHPALLILSGALLGIFLLVTIPFLSVLIRLFLLGHIGTPGESSTDKVWQTDAKARILAWTTLGAWLWTWSTLRGIQRVTVAGVVSHWYFFRDKDDTGDKSQAYDSTLNDSAASSIPGPAPGNWLGDEEAQRGPSQVEVVRASFNRAVGSALGTVCASALILTLARLAALVASSARKISRQLSMPGRPSWMQPIAHVAAILAGISALLQGLSDYALIYVGITGESFLAASRRSTRLITRHTVKGIMDGLVINLILDLTTLALCFLTGVAGFLFSAHNLHVPADAPLVGLLCALVPYWTLRLCADVLGNAADTLYLCYSIDEAGGEEHCKKAAEAFTSPDSAEFPA